MYLKLKKLNIILNGLKLIGLKDSNNTLEKYYIIDDEDIMISYSLVDEMIESKRIAKQKNSKSKNYFAYSMHTNKVQNINHTTQVVESSVLNEE